jgi:hypothetical protein
VESGRFQQMSLFCAMPFSEITQLPLHDLRLDAVRTGPHVRGAAGGRIDSRRLFFFRPSCLFPSL